MRSRSSWTVAPVARARYCLPTEVGGAAAQCTRDKNSARLPHFEGSVTSIHSPSVSTLTTESLHNLFVLPACMCIRVGLSCAAISPEALHQTLMERLDSGGFSLR